MIVYANSCSFGDPKSLHKIYPDFVAEHFSAKLINKGRGATGNRRIVRTTLRDLLDLKINNTQPLLALVGLSYLSRTELWQPNIPAVDNDGNFSPILINDEKIDWSLGLLATKVDDVYNYTDAEVKEYYKQWLNHMSKEALVTDLLTDIIMLVGFCNNHNIKLLLWNNTQLLPTQPEVAIDDVFLKTFVDTVNQSPNVIDLWNFSFATYALSKGFKPADQHIYGINGHPGEFAHENFAEYLINEINIRKIL